MSRFSSRNALIIELAKSMNCSKSDAKNYLAELELAGLIRFDIPGNNVGIMEIG